MLSLFFLLTGQEALPERPSSAKNLILDQPQFVTQCLTTECPTEPQKIQALSTYQQLENIQRWEVQYPKAMLRQIAQQAGKDHPYLYLYPVLTELYQQEYKIKKAYLPYGEYLGLLYFMNKTKTPESIRYLPKTQIAFSAFVGAFHLLSSLRLYDNGIPKHQILTRPMYIDAFLAWMNGMGEKNHKAQENTVDAKPEIGNTGNTEQQSA